MASQTLSNQVQVVKAGRPDSIVRSNSVGPTEEAYSDLIFAYAFFNDQLFEGKLSAPLITLARKPRMLGAFAPKRFQNRDGDIAHEIILNPHYLSQREDFDTLSTLAHEMAHQWREDFGPTPSGKRRGGYHDAEWADCMERIGLMPSHTGKPGGKRTGPRVSHYVINGGPFEFAARKLLSKGFVIRWADRLIMKTDPAASADDDGSPETKKPKDRVKFTCVTCGLNAWAKPSAALKCSPCDEELVSPEATPSNNPSKPNEGDVPS